MSGKQRRSKDAAGSTGGLRFFSLKVVEKIRSRATTTYNAVAQELLDELNQPGACIRDGKSIRRRCYDAINVLLAAGLINRDHNKQIAWRGRQDAVVERLRVELEDRRKEVDRKRMLLQEMERKHSAAEALLELAAARDAGAQGSHGGGSRLAASSQTDDSACLKLTLPFMLVQARFGADMQLRATEDKSAVEFGLSEPSLQLHDDVSVLLQLREHRRGQLQLQNHHQHEQQQQQQQQWQAEHMSHSNGGPHDAGGDARAAIAAAPAPVRDARGMASAVGLELPPAPCTSMPTPVPTRCRPTDVAHEPPQQEPKWGPQHWQAHPSFPGLTGGLATATDPSLGQGGAGASAPGCMLPGEQGPQPGQPSRTLTGRFSRVHWGPQGAQAPSCAPPPPGPDAATFRGLPAFPGMPPVGQPTLPLPQLGIGASGDGCRGGNGGGDGCRGGNGGGDGCRGGNGGGESCGGGNGGGDGGATGLGACYLQPHQDTDLDLTALAAAAVERQEPHCAARSKASPLLGAAPCAQPAQTLTTATAAAPGLEQQRCGGAGALTQRQLGTDAVCGVSGEEEEEEGPPFAPLLPWSADDFDPLGLGLGLSAEPMSMWGWACGLGVDGASPLKPAPGQQSLSGSPIKAAYGGMSSGSPSKPSLGAAASSSPFKAVYAPSLAGSPFKMPPGLFGAGSPCKTAAGQALSGSPLKAARGGVLSGSPSKAVHGQGLAESALYRAPSGQFLSGLCRLDSCLQPPSVQMDLGMQL